MHAIYEDNDDDSNGLINVLALFDDIYPPLKVWQFVIEFCRRRVYSASIFSRKLVDYN